MERVGLDVLVELANPPLQHAVRSTRQRKVPYDGIPAAERKELINKAADLMFEKTAYTLLGAATKVAEEMRIALPAGDTQCAKQAVHRRMKVLEQVKSGLEIMADKENCRHEWMADGGCLYLLEIIKVLKIVKSI